VEREGDRAASWAELNKLLDIALSLPQEERQRWLDTLPSEHATLQPRLRSLLTRAAQVETDDFLKAMPKIGVSRKEAAALRPPTGRSGDIIGPFRLVRELGSGGMAAVWLAERTDGILNRPVALKLPHVSLRHAALGERMAREREILASLAHPNIARLYDAGITADHVPWLAIEYVEGRAIDEYCRAPPHGAALTVRERLRLFLQVGEAVAYAHGKLIVHRDLKPANILVTPDGQVRLLDFGIAKLLEGDVAREPALTEVTGRALTFDYAAPEHIAGGELTTSADVYSLGVILFELVTGRRPLERARGDSQQAFEHAVLNTPPPRASDVAPPEVRRALRGDLDLILQKALKKDPAERYATVNALVEDVARHLDGRPVLVQPDSATYRARKFIGRHKVGVAASAALVLAVLAGTALTAWQARVAFAERDRAEEVKRFIASIFQDTDPYQRGGGNLSAAELLRRAQAQINAEFADRPDLRIELLGIVGASLNGLGEHASAEEVLRQAAADAVSYRGAGSLEEVRVRALLADVFNKQRDTTRLEAELKELLPLARAVEARDPEPLLLLLMYDADLGIELRRIEESRAGAREAFEVARRSFGDHHRLTVQASNLLAETYTFPPYDFEEMLAQSERGLAFAHAAFPVDSRDPLLLYMQMLRIRALSTSGRFREALQGRVENLAALRGALGADNLDVANAIAELGGVERNIGELRDALAHHREALAIYERLENTHSADYMVTLVGFGSTLLAARQPAEALEMYTRAREISEKLTGPTSWDTLGATFYGAWALAYLGRHAEAHKLLAIAEQPDVKIEFPLWFARVSGSIMRLGGDRAGAVAAFERALSLIPDGPRAEWDRMNVHAELGLAELEAGNLEVAQSHLSRAQQIAESLEVTLHPLYAETLSGLGRIELARGHAGAALPLFERVEKFWLEFDPQHAEARSAQRWTERARTVTGQSAEPRRG
jgi:serine/threonine-protein kinase